METPEISTVFKKSISWIKKNILFTILFILLLINAISQFVYSNHAIKSRILEFIDYNLSRFESIVLPDVSLDFQNKSGVARIRSSFTDILIGSDGSIKKGDGYELKLKIINPSSITLRNIRCEFRYNSSQNPVIYEDIKTSISPGNSKTLKCFISDLSDYDLKSIDVSVQFDQISFYQR